MITFYDYKKCIATTFDSFRTIDVTKRNFIECSGLSWLNAREGRWSCNWHDTDKEGYNKETGKKGNTFNVPTYLTID